MSDLVADGLVQPIHLEEELLDHLGDPDSVKRIYKEKLDPELVSKDEAGVREALEFVLRYFEQYGVAPSREVIATETGWRDLRAPKTSVDYVIEKFRERFARRELNRVMKEMGRAVKDPQKALEIGFNQITDLRMKTMPRKTIATTREAGVLEHYHELRARGPGVSFGWPEVDEHLGQGMHRQELYFGCGRLKRGKSWLFCVKPAVEAWRQKRSTVLYTLELSKEEMLGRVTCMIAEVSYPRYKDRLLTPAEDDMIAEAEALMKEWPAEVYVLRPEPGHRSVPMLTQLAREYDPACVFIDQLSYIEHTDPKTTPQWQALHTTCRQLKEATEHFPIMVAAQFNREADSLQEMAGAAQIGLGDAPGQTGDLLIGLYANKEMRKQGIVEYGVMEARSLGGAPSFHIKNSLLLNSDWRFIGEAE